MDQDKKIFLEREYITHVENISNKFNIEKKYLTSIVDYYTSNGYRKMNRILLNPKSTTYGGGDYMRIVILNYLISSFSIPFDLTVHRGISYNQDSQYLFRSLRKDKPLVLKNFTSTSLDEEVAFYFSSSTSDGEESPAIFKIFIKEGTNGLFIPNNPLKDSNEYELILPIGSKMKIINKDNHFYEVELLKGNKYNFTPRLEISEAMNYYKEYVNAKTDRERYDISILTRKLFYSK